MAVLAALVVALPVLLLIPAGVAAQEPAGDPAEAFYRQGIRDLRAGRTVDGEWALHEALRQRPSHFGAHLALGRYYQDISLELALAHLERARDIRPGSDEVYLLLGQTYEALGEPLRAAEQYRQAVRINARQYEADRRLKAILRELRESRTALERAAEQFWRQPNLGALTLYGRLVLQELPPLQALFEFESVRERLPELPEVNLWIARAYRRMDAPDGEIEAYRRYLEARPESDQVRLLLAERLLDTRRYPEADAVLAPLAEKAATGGPLVEREVVAHTALLRSRATVAQGEVGEAAGLLLEAANAGLSRGTVAESFDEYVALFPEVAELRLAQGAWMRSVGRLGEAATAYHAAGLLGDEPRRKARGALNELVNRPESRNEAALGLGELAYREGDDLQARRWLDAIAPAHPAARQAALLRGALARRAGQLEVSLDAFLRYIFSFGDETGIAFARGNVFWETGQPGAAEDVWGQHPRVFDAYPETLARLAGYYQQQGLRRQELATRELLRDREPTRLANRRRLGQLLADAGRDADAAAEWSDIVSLLPGDFDLHVRLATTQLRLGRREAALENLIQAAQLRELTPELSEMLGRELLAAGRYEEAEEVYWALYRREPDHPDLARALPAIAVAASPPLEFRMVAARMAEREGRLNQVEEILWGTVRHYPGEREARMMLAGLLLSRDNPRAAERVIAEDPTSAGLSDLARFRLLAEAQERQGKRAEAVETLARILELAPDDRAARRRLGMLRFELERYGEAVQPLNAVVAADPADAEARFVLARALSRDGQQEAAEGHLRSLLAADPAHEGARGLLIEMLLADQRWEGLVPHLERWVADHPEDAVARYNLITAHLRLFDKEAARPHYEALRELNPTQARRLAPYFR